MEEVIGAAYSKELDLKANLKVSKFQAEGLNVRGRSEKREGNQNRNGGKSKGRSRSKSRNRRTCWLCNKEGHIKRFCPQKMAGKDSDSGDEAHFSDGYRSEDANVLTASIDDPMDEWVMDSGCTFHMSPRKDWFFNLKMEHAGQVLMGNNNSCKIEGIGCIKIKLKDGSIKVLSNVRYIPDLKRNLLSLGVVSARGHCYWVRRRNYIDRRQD